MLGQGTKIILLNSKFFIQSVNNLIKNEEEVFTNSEYNQCKTRSAASSDISNIGHNSNLIDSSDVDDLNFIFNLGQQLQIFIALIIIATVA